MRFSIRVAMSAMIPAATMNRAGAAMYAVRVIACGMVIAVCMVWIWVWINGKKGGRTRGERRAPS